MSAEPAIPRMPGRTPEAVPSALRATLDLLAVALIAFYVGDYAIRHQATQGDFRTYLTAARAALAGLDPYLPGTLERLAGRPVEPFLYPPVALLPFLPVAAIPFRTAAALWTVTQLALLVGLVALWTRGLGRALLLPLALTAVFGWNGSALWGLGTGNLALLEGALLWAALTCFAAGRRTAFAALVVAAACFKLLPAAFLVLLLVPDGERRPGARGLAIALAALAIVVVGPLVVGPTARWTGFLDHVPAAETLGASNPGGLALFTVLAGDAGLAPATAAWVARLAWAAFAIAVLAASAPFLRQAWRTRAPRPWAMAALFLYVLLEPRPMAYGFAILTPAPFFFERRPFAGPVGRLMLALVLSAQGLSRAAARESSALAYTYAPFLLTLCLWALVVAGTPPAAPAPARVEPAAG